MDLEQLKQDLEAAEQAVIEAQLQRETAKRKLEQAQQKTSDELLNEYLQRREEAAAKQPGYQNAFMPKRVL